MGKELERRIDELEKRQLEVETAILALIKQISKDING